MGELIDTVISHFEDCFIEKLPDNSIYKKPMDPVNTNFKRVADLLPFSYGQLEYYVTDDKNKMKMKKKNLKKAVKGGYIWDSYKYMNFKEWRDANGYTDAECEAQGIKKNSMFNQY